LGSNVATGTSCGRESERQSHLDADGRWTHARSHAL